MNQEVESYIQKNFPWAKLPQNVKQLLGGSSKEYDKCIVTHSIKNQLRYRGNLVRNVRKDEERYYEELLEYSKVHLMLYPYHLSDVMVRGLRVTPFQYYVSMVETIMLQERSYDALPNFTAADCLRLLGIGRNQYIDLMNQSRSGRKLFRKRNARELLPLRPVAKMIIEPWWVVHPGSITEDDIKVATESEKFLIDTIIDNGPRKAGTVNYPDLHNLYGKGLIYLEVPIDASDHISVPPLEGFVMNRVLGDYFETLLYKIFVSVDEKTSVGELANVLQIGVDQVKNAVSVYCRLGFARKKNAELEPGTLHQSWKSILNTSPGRTSSVSSVPDEDPLLAELAAALAELGTPLPSEKDVQSKGLVGDEIDKDLLGNGQKRIAFLFDSTLTAFLMMGNLSPGLKSHAVTMFEVGKLSDESLDSLMVELDRICTDDSEGEAQRYFEHALTLRTTVQFLRKARPALENDNSSGSSTWSGGLDLIRVESLQSLDAEIYSRLMCKNYHLLVAMAPLSLEIRSGSVDGLPPFWGPPLPEFTSPWFKLFLYQLTQQGPPTLLLAKGSRLRRLPSVFHRFDRILLTPWGHDSGLVPASNALVVLNEALTHSALMIQGYGAHRQQEKIHISFPFVIQNPQDQTPQEDFWANHSIVQKVRKELDLQNSCGFITMVNLSLESADAANNRSRSSTYSSSSPINGIKDSSCAEILIEELDSMEDPTRSETRPNPAACEKWKESDWTILNVDFGIPLFDSQLNREVCDRITSQKLWQRETLDSLMQVQKSLSERLIEFIRQNVDASVEGKLVASDTVLPTRNLFFLDGKLSTWDGK